MFAVKPVTTKVNRFLVEPHKKHSQASRFVPASKLVLPAAEFCHPFSVYSHPNPNGAMPLACHRHSRAKVTHLERKPLLRSSRCFTILASRATRQGQRNQGPAQAKGRRSGGLNPAALCTFFQQLNAGVCLGNELQFVACKQWGRHLHPAAAAQPSGRKASGRSAAEYCDNGPRGPKAS